MDTSYDTQLYLKDALHFLEKYSWIYTSSNTSFIRDKVLDHLPNSWIDYFQSLSLQEFNKFPVKPTPKENQPECLKEFCHKISSLKREHQQEPFNHKDIYFKKMSPKKLHEISRLSHLIENICGDDVLVDFGSGLGYLSEILYRKRKCKILGLECDEQRVQMANERQSTLYPESKGDILYKEELINEESADHIENYLREISSEDSRISIIGLHSCADLTVTSIKLFLGMSRVKSLVVMPCCYHKLRFKSGQTNSFENFPLSNQLKSLYVGSFLNRPFLRLACQETASRWSVMSEKDHLTHGRNMFQRAALELLLKENESFKKKKKPDEGLCDVTDIYDIFCEDLEAFNKDYQKLLGKFGDSEFVAEVLTCLQATLQSICEDLVLNDRIFYIKEQAEEGGIKVDVNFRKIVDDSLSPRCFALVAQKIS